MYEFKFYFLDGIPFFFQAEDGIRYRIVSLSANSQINCYNLLPTGNKVHANYIYIYISQFLRFLTKRSVI